MFIRFRLINHRLKVYVVRSVRRAKEDGGGSRQTIIVYLGSVPADGTLKTSVLARAAFWEAATPKLKALDRRHRQRLRETIEARIPAPTLTTTRRLSPGSNGPEHDLIMTPAALAQHIVDAFAPRGRLLDPARGDGAFYDALRRHSDDVAWCEISEGIDFLRHNQRCDWIISNPPWSKFRAFLKHSMVLAPNVVFLATLTHFVTRARLRLIDAAGFGIVRVMRIDNPPPPWPGSGGFQLAAVHIRKGAVSVI